MKFLQKNMNYSKIIAIAEPSYTAPILARYDLIQFPNGEGNRLNMTEYFDKKRVID